MDKRTNDRVDELLRMIVDTSLGDSVREFAKTELQVIFSREFIQLGQSARENFYEVFAGMSSGVVALKQAVRDADESGRRAGSQAGRLGKITTAAVIIYTFLTGCLLLVQLRQPAVRCECATVAAPG